MNEGTGSIFIAPTHSIDMWHTAVLIPRLVSIGILPLVPSLLLEEVEEQKNIAEYLLYVIYTQSCDDGVASLIEAFISLQQDVSRTVILFLSPRSSFSQIFDELIQKLQAAVPEAHIFTSLDAMLSWLSETSASEKPA